MKTNPDTPWRPRHKFFCRPCETGFNTREQLDRHQADKHGVRFKKPEPKGPSSPLGVTRRQSAEKATAQVCCGTGATHVGPKDPTGVQERIEPSRVRSALPQFKQPSSMDGAV